MPSPSFKISTAGLVLAAMLPAAAASPDAWATFRRHVEASCRVAAAPLVTQPQIVVDPFGSQSYGLAFINGIAVEGGTTRSLVCIYDKVAKTAEIGGTMALEQAVPSLQPGAASAASVDPASPAGDPAGASRSLPVPDAAPASNAAPPAPASPPAAVATEARPSADEPTAPVRADEDAAVAALSERFLSPSAAPAIDAVPAQASALTATAGRAPAAAADAPDGTATAALSTSVPALPGTPAAPGTASFAGQCNAACSVTLASLGEPDRKEILDLSAEVKRAIDRNAAASLGEGPAKARDAALAAAASVEGEKLGAVAVPDASLAGERSCVLYYFGYSGEAARTVGRHRCAVSEGEGGGLVVEKTSGERLRAEVKPLTGEVAAFVGRTYQSGQSETRYDAAKPVSSENSELGNTVGFAAASEGGLMLVSSQRRRFEATEDFFWVLAVDAK